MRLIALLVLLLPALARADDGYYFTESIGGAGFRGELGRYDGSVRLQMGFGVRRGDRAVEVFGAGIIPDAFAIDCYGDECAYAAGPSAGLATFGVDARQRWRLLSLRRLDGRGTYERPGVFVAVHGGPRWFVGTDALDGRSGPGVGGGVALEGDLWVIGYYLDAGIDVMRLGGERDAVHGSAPYVGFGAKLGWL